MLLSKHSNEELRELFEEATRTQDAEYIWQHFGKPPYPFFGVSSGPAPRYANFVPQYRDANGLQYRLIEDDSLLAVRIPIPIRRKNPTIDWPWEGSQLELQALRGTDAFTVRVISLQKNRSRSSTAIMEFVKIE